MKIEPLKCSYCLKPVLITCSCERAKANQRKERMRKEKSNIKLNTTKKEVIK